MSVRVLVADSSTSIHKVVELALAHRDVELVTVTEGSAALEKSKELRPHILFADIELSEIDGYSLCDRVKKEPSLAETKVVLLKPSFAVYDLDRAALVKADSMLEKPFSAAALVNMIEFQTGETISVEDSEEDVIPEVEEIAPAEVAAPTEETTSGEMRAKEEGVETGTKKAVSGATDMDVSDEATFADISLEEDSAAGETGEEAEAEKGGAKIEVEDVDAHQLKPGRIDIQPEPIVISEEEKEPAAEPEPTAEEGEAAGIEKTELVGGLDEEKEPTLEEEVSTHETELEEVDSMVERVTERVLERLREMKATEIDLEISSEEGSKLIGEIVRRLSDDVIREVAWEVVPELAEKMIRAAIEEITGS